MSAKASRPSSSPCTKICTIDAAKGICTGCGRTLAEIGEWSRLGEDQRKAIMRILPERMAKMGMATFAIPALTPTG